MKKILVVDDELPIREWLKITIEKQCGDAVLVQTAVNGKDAWEIYQQTRPDIVFTDIKMPVMDGLELTRRIRGADQDAYIVILTSYSDFEYARIAFSNHVSDYILKTEISGESLRQIIDRHSQTQPRAPHLEIPTLEEYCAALEDYVQKGGKEPSPRYSFVVPDAAYFCVALQLAPGEHANLPTDTNMECLFSATLEHHVSLACFGLGNIANTLMQTQAVFAFVQHLEDVNEHHVISFSRPKTNALNLPLTVKNVVSGLHGAFYQPGYIFPEQIPSAFSSPALLTELGARYLKITQALQHNCRAEAKSLLQDFFLYVENTKPLQVSYIKELCKKICLLLFSLQLASQELAQEKAAGTDAAIDQAPSLDALRNFVLGEFDRISSDIPDLPTKNTAIRKAAQYIALNYKTVSGLSEVAGFVNLNPEYFSRLFKEETGQTFNSYLNEYRLNKAAELVANSNKKLSDIASDVGFSSLSYFSKKFKRHFGANPFSYKQGDRLSDGPDDAALPPS